MNSTRDMYNQALAGLKSNVRKVIGFDSPVLIEGGNYKGIWLECGPQEGLVYGRFYPEVAIANHDVFFHHQRDDGQFPCSVQFSRVLFSQIQMVVPITATAWETAQMTGDEAFLARAYKACVAWDGWLARNRNTRGTGLCEMFCEFDTGHDKSPRIAGMPRKCPEDEARNCPTTAGMPRLAPDLSATVYGGRLALAEMADALGAPAEARQWRYSAETLRHAIIDHCFDPEDECFYDVDCDGNFVKIRCDLLTRVLGEHVVDQNMFELMYARYIHNPDEFWTPYPLPSVSVSDPSFVKELPDNSWGGAAQALTALRTPRWFTHYGKADDLAELMRRWVQAIQTCGEFMQQMNPWTGEFSTSVDYSPAMCVLIDFVDRLDILETRGNA